MWLLLMKSLFQIEPIAINWSSRCVGWSVYMYILHKRTHSYILHVYVCMYVCTYVGTLYMCTYLYCTVQTCCCCLCLLVYHWKMHNSTSWVCTAGVVVREERSGVHAKPHVVQIGMTQTHLILLTISSTARQSYNIVFLWLHHPSSSSRGASLLV